jgi:hypothetical protein
MSTYTNDNNDVSKLIILVIGVATISLFVYLIFRERNIVQPQQTLSLDQKLLQLEEKINKINTMSPVQPTISEPRNIVSMSTRLKPQQIKNVKNYFDMA